MAGHRCVLVSDHLFSAEDPIMQQKIWEEEKYEMYDYENDDWASQCQLGHVSPYDEFRWVGYFTIVGRGGIERGFLSQKGSGVGRGVNEKDANVTNLEVVKDGVVPSFTVASGNTQVVSTGPSLPTVVDLMMEKDKLSSLEDTTVLESFSPLSTPVTTAGDALGKSSYANITTKPSGKKVNVRTLFTPGGNGIDVVVSVDSIRAISERFANTTYGSPIGLFSFQVSSIDGLYAMLENGPWFIRNNPLILKKWHPDENLLKEDSWGRSSYARVMIELRADVELKDNIIVAMPKITREGYYTCNVRVEYEWKPPRYSSCKDFGHIHEECPKNTSVGEKKTMKKPSQTSRGVPKGVEPIIEVSNSNPFDVRNSVDNDVEFGTNEGTTNLVNNAAISSKLRLLDNDENPLVPTGIVESDSEVEVLIWPTEVSLGALGEVVIMRSHVRALLSFPSRKKK
nr:hypothetical protein [Tanacetum cinerariifolium]